MEVGERKGGIEIRERKKIERREERSEREGKV